MGAESYVGTPLRDSAGRVIGLMAAIDRSPLADPELAESLLRIFAARAAAELERQQAEESLRQSEEQFRQLTESIREVFWLASLSGGRTLYVSPAFERVWGRSRESIERGPLSWLDAVHPEDRLRVREWLEHRPVDRESEIEYRVLRPNGAVRWVRDRAFPIPDAQGRPYRMAGLAEDITERRELETQLRQMQKMEAVGRLAGGVAHDFNNLLTVISGYTALLLESLDAEDTRRLYTEEIAKASRRAAELTRQLLAFGRKQILAPRALDLNALVLDAEKMLCQLIGEDVTLVTVLHPEIGHVRADPGQLHQVLLNLAVNARDAMPQGGTLTFETVEIPPGQAEAVHPDLTSGSYALLKVSDTGRGMAEEVKTHLFDPFFTTKELGRGTGLGLSTVYGIIKQSGGHIEVESEVGRGSTFKIYLPRVEAAPSAESGAVPAPRASQGWETVLLVEDQEEVRAFTRFILERAGYTVFETADADQALRIRREHPGPIHLLIVGVVMPRMSGRELAERLALPGLRVLYVSGYADDAVVRHGGVEAGAALLQKPFSPLILLAKVREVLDQPEALKLDGMA